MEYDNYADLKSDYIIEKLTDLEYTTQLKVALYPEHAIYTIDNDECTISYKLRYYVKHERIINNILKIAKRCNVLLIESEHDINRYSINTLLIKNIIIHVKGNETMKKKKLGLYLLGVFGTMYEYATNIVHLIDNEVLNVYTLDLESLKQLKHPILPDFSQLDIKLTNGVKAMMRLFLNGNATYTYFKDHSVFMADRMCFRNKGFKSNYIYTKGNDISLYLIGDKVTFLNY